MRKLAYFLFLIMWIPPSSAAIPDGSSTRPADIARNFLYLLHDKDFERAAAMLSSAARLGRRCPDSISEM